jgi:hypothetical protein
LLPLKDFSRIARYSERVIREHKINRLDVDAFHFRRYNNKDINHNYTPIEIEESAQYLRNNNLIDETGNVSKDVKTNAYYQKKVLPRMKQTMFDDVVYAGAKKFGEQSAKDMLNIAKKSGMEAIKIINNRYSYQDFSGNSELEFALEMSVLSPMDYAMSYAFDKKGKLRNDIDRNEMDKEVMRRYATAYGLKSGPFSPLNPEALAKFYLDYMSNTYVQEQREK